MARTQLVYIKIGHAIFYTVLVLIFNFFLMTYSTAADSLSYSGRLVQTNGAPVAGPVDLKIELAYTNATSTVLCSQSFTNIVLSNGVFHLKLDLNCGANGSLADVLNLVPANESAAIRVTDVTHSKAYFFQAIHSMPFASVSGTAKQLVQMGATNNQVLKWNDTTKKWEPGSIAGAGTVTSVSGTLPISVGTGSTSPVVSISQANTTTDGYLSSADWNAFNSKQGSIAAGTTAQYYRGDKTWLTLDTGAVPENVANLYFTNARALGVPLTGFAVGAGSIVATDTALQAFGKAQGQIDAINTASANYLIKNSTDSITGVVNVGTIGLLQLAYTPVGLNDATNKSYVDAGDNLKVNKAGDTMSGVLTLDSDLKIKGGVNYVTLKGHAASSAYNLVLPSSPGTAGYVLSTDGSGNTSWINPGTVSAGTGTVTSASIVDGTIVDADISATAAIAQSKIANLTTDLSSKQSTTLANGNILVGNAGNVATAVAVSGDATLSSTGVLTLANSGATAGTFNSVTVDAKGRVTGGTNPTTLAGYGITDVLVTGVSVTAPVTNTGTASVPLIGMPAATTTVDGYLKAADWNTFNNKQAAITAASTINTGSITTNLQSGLVVSPYGTSAGNTGEIRLKELAANGANYVALRSPDALAADILFTLPSGVGSAGQVLTTDGLNPATLSWTNVATTGTSLVGDIGGTVGANTIGAGKVTLTHLSATGTKDATTYLAGDNTWKNFNTNVIAAPLTGLSSAGITKANGTLAATDSITSAFNKLLFAQGDYVSKSADQTINGTLAINSLTGFITVPTPVTPNDAANKDYVDSFGQWIKGTGANAGDIYRTSGNVGIGTNAPSSSSVLELNSTAQGFLPPRMTTAQRDAILSPSIGLIIFNTTTNEVQVFSGSWQAVGTQAQTCKTLYNSCAAIKAANSGSPDGTYLIDPDGVGLNDPIGVYCDMTTAGGGWTLLSSASDGYYFTSAEKDAYDINTPTPTSNKYSILAKADSIGGASGVNRQYLYLERRTNGNRWISVQQSNLLASSTITGFSVISYSHAPNMSYLTGFGASTNGNSFYDGNISNWIWAIAQRSAYSTNGYVGGIYADGTSYTDNLSTGYSFYVRPSTNSSYQSCTTSPWTQINSNVVFNSGNVGIGTTSPSVALDVNGALRAGSSTTVTNCGMGEANGEGSQRYNYTTHTMEYCNGTSWLAIGGGLGVGQTWTNVTASRVAGTTYTNSTGKPIEVIVSTVNASTVSAQQAIVDGLVIGYVGSMASRRSALTFIVPNGSTYSTVIAGTNAIESWYELR